MSDKQLKKDLSTGFLGLMVVIGAFFLCGLFVFILNAFGVIGNTIVEREVYERSYQRSESLKSQIAMEEANLAEIERQLSNPSLDENTRSNLEAQQAAARVRLQTARNKK